MNSYLVSTLLTHFIATAAIVCPKAAAFDLSKLDIDGAAVVDQIKELAKYSDDPNPAVTRILFAGNLTSILSFPQSSPTTSLFFLRLD